MRTPILTLILALTLAGCAVRDQNPGTPVTSVAPASPQTAVLIEDFQTFSLGPGQDIEWKYGLEEGASMEYTWSASRPVRFDFHGDYDDGTDDFVSHKRGTLAADQGAFTAPFAGRHGWYFQNPNSQALTITLEAEGDFEVVGRTGGNAP